MPDVDAFLDEAPAGADHLDTFLDEGKEPQSASDESPAVEGARMVASIGSGIYANAKAGVSSLWGLAHGKSVAELDKANQKSIKEDTYLPPEGSAAAQGLQILGSNRNPLNWPGLVTGAIGEGISKAGNNPIALPNSARFGGEAALSRGSGLPTTGGGGDVAGPVVTGGLDLLSGVLGAGVGSKVAGEASDVARLMKPNDALHQMRETIGPDVSTANPVDHGETLIAAYKAKAAAADADISAKYKALKDANGGQFPADAGLLKSQVEERLNNELLLDHAPPAVMKTINRLADDDNMTFGNYEALRTNLARIQRTSTDGNERAAAGVIRGALEDLPMPEGTAALKPLADTARAAARAQKQAIEADPAYKAAVNDEVPADRFVRRFVINGNRDDVATMRANLAEHPEAQQTIGVAALDHLRAAAGVDPFGTGNFSGRAFNSAWRTLSPKRSVLFGDEAAGQYLDELGGVSNQVPSAAKEHLANAAEGLTNYAAHGLPVGTGARKVLKRAFPSGPRIRPYEPTATEPAQ